MSKKKPCLRRVSWPEGLLGRDYFTHRCGEWSVVFLFPRTTAMLLLSKRRGVVGIVVFGSRGRPGYGEGGAVGVFFAVSPAIGFEDDHSCAVETDKHEGLSAGLEVG